jgi:hypothetical protein
MNVHSRIRVVRGIPETAIKANERGTVVTVDHSKCIIELDRHHPELVDHGYKFVLPVENFDDIEVLSDASLKLFDDEGKMLPFRHNGAYLWLVDDYNVIREHGPGLAMTLPQGSENGYAIPSDLRELIGRILAAAPTMFNFILGARDGGKSPHPEAAAKLIRDILKED